MRKNDEVLNFDRGGRCGSTERGCCIRTPALPFDFSLPAGSIIGLTGLDGAGQDHFARIVVGINRAMIGALTPLYGLEAAARASIVWVSGDRKREGIFPQESILENLAVGVYRPRLGAMSLIDKRAARRAFDREVDRFKIKLGSPSNRITSLSGGNQQKVLIGRAFANDLKVIVLNDPARGVDIGTERDLYCKLRGAALRRAGWPRGRGQRRRLPCSLA